MSVYDMEVYITVVLLGPKGQFDVSQMQVLTSGTVPLNAQKTCASAPLEASAVGCWPGSCLKSPSHSLLCCWTCRAPMADRPNPSAPHTFPVTQASPLALLQGQENSLTCRALVTHIYTANCISTVGLGGT